MRKIIAASISVIALSGCHPRDKTADGLANSTGNNVSAIPANESPALSKVPTVKVISYTSAGTVVPNSSKVLVDSSDLLMPAGLSFADQIKRHASILDRLGQVDEQAEANKKAASDAKDLAAYQAAEADIDNVKKALLPYATAQAQADSLKAQGYKMNDLSGNICLGASCKSVDSMTGFFFFTGDRKGLGPAFADNGGQGDTSTRSACPGGDNGDVCVNGFNVSLFIRFLSDKPLDYATAGLLPKIRDSVIDPNNNGEITKLIRDPGKRPVEIVQNMRDKVESTVGIGGDAKKIINDPIKCTVGKLFGKC